MAGTYLACALLRVVQQSQVCHKLLKLGCAPKTVTSPHDLKETQSAAKTLLLKLYQVGNMQPIALLQKITEAVVSKKIA